MIEQTNEAQLDSFKARVAEHGLFKSILESFAYIRPFGGMFGKIVPFYAESYWYAMGGLTFLMFVFLTGSGVILALLGPYWWLTNPFVLIRKRVKEKDENTAESRSEHWPRRAEPDTSVRACPNAPGADEND